jgi:hypothetical protein
MHIKQLCYCSKKNICSGSNTELIGDLAGDNIVGDITGELTGDIAGDIAGDNIANILYNCSKIIEKLYQKNILM